MKDFKMDHCSFKAQYGQRMEVQSHNFVVIRNVINTSLSYMTLVMKDHIDKYGFTTYNFDLEGNDYILERSSIFTSGTLVTQ